MNHLYAISLLLTLYCSSISAWPWTEVSEANIVLEKVKEIGKDLGEKYCLEQLNAHVGDIVNSRDTAYDFNMMTHQYWTIDQARQVVHALIQELYVKISRVPNLQKVQNERRMLVENFHTFDPTFTPETLGLKIALWDKNMNRPNPPYLSRVMVRDGYVYYYYAKPDQSLEEPITEPF